MMKSMNERIIEQDVETTSRDGVLLKGRLWTRSNGASPRGTLVIAHGLGEHGGCYRHVVEALAEFAEIDAIAFDFRGHGRSPGRRGVVRCHDDLTLDLLASLEFAARARPVAPIVLLGHSNGGLVAIKTLLHEQVPDVRALILSNPALRLSVEVPRWKLTLGKILRATAPTLTLSAALPIDRLTRDPSCHPDRASDRLRHSRTSPGLFFGMVEHGEAVRNRAREIEVSTLLILGGADSVVDPAASRAFFDALGGEDKTLLLHPEAVHEPLNDLDRRAILADFGKWLAERVGTRF